MAASEPAPSGSRTALMRSRDTGVLGSIVMTSTRAEGKMLRVQALGETTTELEIDEPLGRTELATSTARGRLVAPPRFERPERQALRRAIEVAGHGTPVPDLEQLRHDAEAAELILRSGDANLFG
jgi:hypothetical protein